MITVDKSGYRSLSQVEIESGIARSQQLSTGASQMLLYNSPQGIHHAGHSHIISADRYSAADFVCKPWLGSFRGNVSRRIGE